MGWKHLFRHHPRDAEINEEIQSHLRMAIQDRVDHGESPQQARTSARREFGNAGLAQEDTRAVWISTALERLRQDLKYAARQMRRSPGFAAVAILTLALGIGASTSIFSVADAVLLRPLPYPNPQTIVRVWEQAPDGHRMNLADPNFDDFRTQNNTFAYLAVYGYGLSSVSGGSEPVRVNIAKVSTGFFEALGVEPFRGRAFSAEEQRLHGAPAAIVSCSCEH